WRGQLEQRARISRPQPGDGIERERAPLSSAEDSEDERSDPHRRGKQLAGSLRLLQAVMFREEAQVRAQLLAVHAGPDCSRRGSADVDELRAGPEDDGPAGFPGAEAKVDLLVEHEEARIECADLLQHLTAHEHHRAHDEVGLAARAVVEAAAVERVERTAVRREPAKE